MLKKRANEQAQLRDAGLKFIPTTKRGPESWKPQQSGEDLNQ